MSAGVYKDMETSITSIRKDITHTTDGPLTDFVLICRAMDAVKAGATSNDVANALYEEMQMRGMLTKEPEYDV